MYCFSVYMSIYGEMVLTPFTAQHNGFISHTSVFKWAFSPNPPKTFDGSSSLPDEI